MDGGYNDYDNGRKITCIYYPTHASYSVEQREKLGKLRMYKRRKNPYELGEAFSHLPADADEIEEDIEPKQDRLVLFRSRDMPHEVLENKAKRFAVSFYI